MLNDIENTRTIGGNFRILFLLFFFIILNIADIFLTQYALGHGLSEMNPVLSRNMFALIPIKVVGIVLILILAAWCEKKYQSKNAILAPIALMGFVVVWNIIQIMKSGVI